jgi:hypothetical protein
VRPRALARGRRATYLPDSDKDQLTYVKARDLVGEKKEKPALDLNARLAVTLLEVIAAGLAQRGIATWAPGETIVTRFHRAAVGGPLAQLQERKLIAFGFLDRQVVARTALSEDVVRWLKQIAFHDDPNGALWRARTAVQGELATNVMERDGQNVTPELNAPRAHPPAVENASPAPTETPELAGVGSLNGDPRELEPSPDAGQPAPAAAPIAPAGEPELPAMLAIVLVEAAHRICADGVERGPETWGVPVLASYYKDSRVSQLVQGHKMLAFLPNGEKTLVALGKAGRNWLWEKYGVECEAGRPIIGDALLLGSQEELLGAALPDGGPLYSTPWLNPPGEAAAAPEPAPPTAANQPGQTTVFEVGAGGASGGGGGIASYTGRGDDLTRGVLGLAAERRAITALAAAARQAKSFAEGLRTRTKSPKAEDIDPIVALLTSALEAIVPFLEDGTQADG